MKLNGFFFIGVVGGVVTGERGRTKNKSDRPPLRPDRMSFNYTLFRKKLVGMRIIFVLAFTRTVRTIVVVCRSR